MPAFPESYVEVPVALWAKARFLLLKSEAEAAIPNTENSTVRVIFNKEEDARAFTHLFREECGSLLAVFKVRNLEDIC